PGVPNKTGLDLGLHVFFLRRPNLEIAISDFSIGRTRRDQETPVSTRGHVRRNVLRCLVLTGKQKPASNCVRRRSRNRRSMTNPRRTACQQDHLVSLALLVGVWERGCVAEVFPI